LTRPVSRVRTKFRHARRFLKLIDEKTPPEAVKGEVERFAREELGALRASVELMALQQRAAERDEASYRDKISRLQAEIKVRTR
jgi:hypothetical protein